MDLVIEYVHFQEKIICFKLQGDPVNTLMIAASKFIEWNNTDPLSCKIKSRDEIKQEDFDEFRTEIDQHDINDYIDRGKSSEEIDLIIKKEYETGGYFLEPDNAVFYLEVDPNSLKGRIIKAIDHIQTFIRKPFGSNIAKFGLLWIRLNNDESIPLFIITIECQGLEYLSDITEVSSRLRIKWNSRIPFISNMQESMKDRQVLEGFADKWVEENY